MKDDLRTLTRQRLVVVGNGMAGIRTLEELLKIAPGLYDITVFGAEPQKYNFIAANFEKLRGAKAVKLSGDHDVFGDGSVTIKAAPGHTPGHQVLVVRLPRTGPVMLSGDMVHLVYSWENRVVPSFNFDVAQSGRTIDAMKAWAAANGVRLWVNHDKEQHAALPKAPRWVE